MPPPPLFPSPLLPSLVPDTRLSASASGALPPQPPSHSINRIPSSSAMPPPPPLPSLAPDTRLSASAPGALPTQPPSPSTNSIPPAPHKPMVQRGGHVTVHVKMLHLDATQTKQIQQHYDVATNFHRLFSDELHSQQEASCMLQAQRLDLRNMDDLGNGWSKRWSKRHGKGLNVYTRMLLQCQCGTSTDARKTKDDQQQMAKGLPINEKPWLRKTPYDHTGCLAHLDITYHMSDYHVRRITGVLSHNDSCLARKMMRLPAIPLHDHVWQVALQQMMGGASITSIQARHVELCHEKMYSDQATHDPRTMNVRYEILPSDSCRLYHKYSRMHGIDVSEHPQYNLDNWLNPESTAYKPELAGAVFDYQARVEKDGRLRICIQTAEMKDAAWKYAHQGQLILDGTFGI
ncbi:hypothetical protein JB92DRAFT_3100178, partial [Gautieria morchelliformis]